MWRIGRYRSPYRTQGLLFAWVKRVCGSHVHSYRVCDLLIPHMLFSQHGTKALLPVAACSSHGKESRRCEESLLHMRLPAYMNKKVHMCGMYNLLLLHSRLALLFSRVRPNVVLPLHLTILQSHEVLLGYELILNKRSPFFRVIPFRKAFKSMIWCWRE